jgi:hypothetical protein
MRCFFFSFAERQKFLPEILSIASCLQNCLLGNPETKAALTNIPLDKYPDLPKIFSIYFHRFLGVPKLSHYISWLNQTIPRSFFICTNYPNALLACLTQTISHDPSRVFLHQLFHVHISSAVTHRFVVIARICWNVWIWPWMGFNGFNWNMLLASGKSCIKKKFGFGRVKSPVR